MNRLDRPSEACREVTTPAALDQALIKEIAKGDRLAMQALFQRHRVRVYRFALRMLRDATAAEDVISEVFFDVWQQAARFQGRSTVSTWLLAITRHKALSTLRKRPTEPLDGEAALNVVDPADDPEVRLHRTSRGALLRRCLGALSREHAEIIDLVYYQEKSISEIADILDIPENTVKTRMFYARKRLAGLLAETGMDRSPA
jgi:RNA polymerase sigma-70 factor (ECF subfamily)